MDPLFTRLEEVSQVGDVNSLKELLNKDKHLLEKVTGSTLVRDNPLHIAAMLGHANFVREVIYHKPELAKELNSQGLSPLHLAAAHGHVTVVKELLKDGLKNLKLCLISEIQEGLLPLHIAVKKRRTVIVKELVEACEEGIHKVTNGGETILHLAVKYNSFDTVEFLIDRVHDLNEKDGDRGNTILHYAVASKQLSVIKLLLNKAVIDVNIKNSASLTPLDVLLGSWPQNGDLVLGEMIRAAGGKTAVEVSSESEHVIRDTVLSDISNPVPKRRTSPPQLQESVNRGSVPNETKEPTSEPQKKKEEKKYDPHILLVVSTLVATVTFQAALNPPGGFNPNDHDHQKTKGQPVLGDSLNNFQILDMLALFSSVSVMMLLLCVVPRKKKIVMKFLVWVIWGASLLMGLAFTEGISVLYDYGRYFNDKDNSDDDSTRYHDRWSTAPFLLQGWFILLRLGIFWVLVRFLVFLLNKSGLMEPVRRPIDSLQRGWQQFSNVTKINGSNCFELFKKVICIVLILGVLAAISCLLYNLVHMLYSYYLLYTYVS